MRRKGEKQASSLGVFRGNEGDEERGPANLLILPGTTTLCLLYLSHSYEKYLLFSHPPFSPVFTSHRRRTMRLTLGQIGLIGKVMMMVMRRRRRAAVRLTTMKVVGQLEGVGREEVSKAQCGQSQH